MNDNDIINDLSNRKQIKWKFLDNNIKQYLFNRYDDNYSSCEKLMLKESYYRILNNIEKCPTCPICGNKCKFLSFSYSRTCGSPKCLANECQKRREQTYFEKYGYYGNFGNKHIQDKAKEKQYETKKKNHTLNSSKIELESYDLLKRKYPDVIHHYKDNNRYPFNCDFYIPSLDLFIECQYGQFHHGRPYLGTENDLKDVEMLKENAKRRCEETGKDKSRYDNELETWTIRDVNKRNIVKQNNLNYIEFWNIEELKIWINDGK